MKKIIEKSQISDENVALYEGIRIVNSEINGNSVVGDFSRVTNSVLKGHNRIDRNTLIYHSQFGKNSYIGSNSVVMHAEIGKFCSLSWGITIGPANHDYEFISSHDFLYNDFYGIKPKNGTVVYDRFSEKTKIGNDVWIGTGAVILNGIKVGDGAVIGANAIVTKDVLPYAIIVGNPGKIVKFRFSEKIIEQLLELKWWDFPNSVLSEHFHSFATKDIQTGIDNLKRFKK